MEMASDKKRHALWFNFFRTKEDWIEETARLCQKHRLFKGIPPSVVHWFVSTMHRREYQQGERVFFAGDEGAGAILVLSGAVEIRHREVLLTTVGPGEIFGEVALVDGTERTADAVAIEQSTLIFMLRADLDEWMNRQPKNASVLLRNLGGMLAKRLLEANRALSETAGQ